MQKELQHPETSWPAVKDPQQYRWISLIQISPLKSSFLLRETLSIRRAGHLPELKEDYFALEHSGCQSCLAPCL